MEPLQIVLIGLLIVITPLGFWNMQRMKRKKQQEMLMGTTYSSMSMNNENEKNTNSLPPETEEKAKSYIEQYQASYPKESLEQGLLELGITSEQAKEVVNKYYSK